MLSAPAPVERAIFLLGAAFDATGRPFGARRSRVEGCASVSMSILSTSSKIPASGDSSGICIDHRGDVTRVSTKPAQLAQRWHRYARCLVQQPNPQRA